MIKKSIATVLLITLFLVNSFTAFAGEPIITSNSGIPVKEMSFETVRSMAEQQKKSIDINKFETSLKNAKNINEQIDIIAEMQSKAVYTNTVYYNSEGLNINTMAIAAVEGDTRITTSYSYGARTTYSSKTSSTINALINTTLSIGSIWTHPAFGALCTVVGLIPQSDYTNYSGIIQATLYDYVITTKTVDVYRSGSWQPMVIATKKTTSGQLNTVYYYKNIRKTPSNIDLNIIKTETGQHFNDDTYLKNFAKSTLDPYVFPYNVGGTTVNYKNASVFTY